MLLDIHFLPQSPCPSSRRTIFVPSTMASSLGRATQRGVGLKPQSGLIQSFSAGTYFSAMRIRSATSSGVST
jgi:hypothetical protein